MTPTVAVADQKVSNADDTVSIDDGTVSDGVGTVSIDDGTVSIDDGTVSNGAARLATQNGRKRRNLRADCVPRVRVEQVQVLQVQAHG
jgi:hypothetical protein